MPALFRLYLTFPWAALGVVGAMLLQLAFALGFPIGARVVVDTAIGGGDLRVLALALAALGAGFLLSTAAAVSQDRLTANNASRLVQRVRGGVFGEVLSAPDRVLTTRSPADVLSRFANDVAAVEGAVVRGVPSATLHSLLAGTSVALLFITDWRLGVACTLASPLVLLGPRLLGRRAVDASERKKSQEARALDHVHSTVHAWPVIHAFRQRPAVLTRYRETSERLRAASARANFLAALLGRVSTLGVMLLVLIAVALGSALAVRGQISLGALLAAVALLFNLEAAAVGLTAAIPLLLQGAAGWRRIAELRGGQVPVGVPPALAAASAAAPPVQPLSVQQRIALVGLTLTTSEGQAIVDAVSAELTAGQLVVLLGASGSGKTSLIELLAGVRTATGGEVLLDDTPAGQLDQERLLESVGVAFQAPQLLPGTVADNIRVGRQAADDEEVAAAARAAQIYDAIAELPAGFDTEVGGEAPLSGGEVQRIALARALVRRPALLLLDEATGALDPLTEQGVVATIRSLAPPTTVLWATHHVSHAAAADHVLVMERGRLVEQGSHNRLLGAKGVYARLWHSQQGFHLSDDGSGATVDGARLADIPLLSTLPRRYLRQIAGRFVSRVFEPDQVIVAEGGAGSHFYLIARGQVEIVRGPDQGRPVATLDSGAFFGEVSLLTGEPANATVRSVERTVCLALSRERFLELIAESPRLEAAIRPVMEERRLHRGDGGADRRSAAGAR